VKIIIAAIALATSSLAFANHCPMDMKAIDAKLAEPTTLSAADMTKVKQLRADGEKQHKAGNHAESEKTLGEARKMLGI
jgi:hypothetical protein